MSKLFSIIASVCSDHYVSSASKPWISKAIKKPGAFRNDLKRLGILKDDELITQSHIEEALKHAKKTGDKKLAKRANLAKTLIGISRKSHAKRSGQG